MNVKFCLLLCLILGFEYTARAENRLSRFFKNPIECIIGGLSGEVTPRADRAKLVNPRDADPFRRLGVSPIMDEDQLISEARANIQAWINAGKINERDSITLLDTFEFLKDPVKRKAYLANQSRERLYKQYQAQFEKIESLKASLPAFKNNDFEHVLGKIPKYFEEWIVLRGADPKHYPFGNSPDFSINMTLSILEQASALKLQKITSFSELLQKFELSRNQIGGETLNGENEFGVPRKDDLYTPAESYRYAPYLPAGEHLLEVQNGISNEIKTTHYHHWLDEGGFFKGVEREAKIPNSEEWAPITAIMQKNNGSGRVTTTWVHPKGEMPASLTQRLNELYKIVRDPLTSHKQVIESVAEIYWWIANRAPYHRGSAAIADATARALLLSRDLLPGQYRPGVIPDLEAFTRDRANFVKIYSSFFDSP